MAGDAVEGNADVDDLNGQAKRAKPSTLMGSMIRTALIALGLIGCIGAHALEANASDYQPTGPTPTAEDYVAHIGGKATIVESGDLKIGGHRVACGVRPVVLDPNLDDFAAAYDGFIILNPTKLEGLAPAVSLWIYSHECGHQFRGPDEEGADCFAVQRGRRQGWMTAAGVEQICNFISPSHGDMMHFSGPLRCETVRRCFGAKDNF